MTLETVPLNEAPTPAALIAIFNDPKDPLNFMFDWEFTDTEGDNMSSTAHLVAAALVRAFQSGLVTEITNEFIKQLPDLVSNLPEEGDGG